MKPTGAHNTTHADDARMIHDETKEQTESGRLALQAAPSAPPHAAPSAEHKQSDNSSMDERKPMEDAITESTPAPSTRHSKRVREPQAEAAAAATAAVPLAASSSSRSSKQARTAPASSVQQQKPDSASAKNNGSDSRASRSKPQQGGEDESASEVAAAAAASSLTKRTSAVAASSNSGASSRSTAASAASARPSPCSRLDADSLGVALSCLDANEFFVARLVSKQWLAASAKRTAWPQVQVDDFIRLMHTDAYDDPSRRRLVVNTEDKLRSFVKRFSAQRSQDVFGKHVSEVKFSVKVSSAAKGSGRKPLMRSALTILAAQVQFLSTLTLHHCFFEPETIIQLYTALMPHLRVLILSNCGAAPYRQVSLLTQLRVLVVDTMPPAESLRSLVSLRYLHVRISAHQVSASFSSNHGRVLRWLSVNHALRSLSMELLLNDYPAAAAVRVNELVALTEADANRTHNWERALPAPIVLVPPLDFAVPARFTDLSLGDQVPVFLGHWNSLPDLISVA